MASAAGFSASEGAGGQPDVGRKGGTGAAPVLRPAAVAQPEAILRDLPPAGKSLHGRAGARAGVHRRTASAWSDESAERGVRAGADVGESQCHAAGATGARAAVRRTSRGTGAGGEGRRAGPAAAGRAALREVIPRGVSGRSGSGYRGERRESAGLIRAHAVIGRFAL